MIFSVTIFAYLLGSIPFGLLLTRLAGLGDIRAIGSGNIGATNVLRTGHKGLAAATLLLDGLKGVAAVVIAQQIGYPAPLCAGFAVFLGHVYPVWLKFKGGKGVATGLGVLLAEFFPLGFIICAVWLAAALALRRSSAAALMGFAVSPLAALAFGNTPLALLALLVSTVVFWKHRGNIARLLAGTEPKIGQKP